MYTSRASNGYKALVRRPHCSRQPRARDHRRLADRRLSSPPHRFVTTTVLAALGLSCSRHNNAAACADDVTREQCLFETATQPASSTTPGGTPDTPQQATPVPITEPGWDRAEEILRDGVDFLRIGSGATDMIGDRWCASPPTPQSGEAATIWVCALREPPRLRGHELTLEFDRYALFSLTGFGYSHAEGRDLVSAGVQRWSTWCRTQSFIELESGGADQFYRCALSDGPMLIVGRFARDLEADLWQVSLAIIGPG